MGQVEEIEGSSTTLTARGALLRLHALFAPVTAVSLAVVAQSAPRALGLIVCALLAAWHLGVVAIAIAWDDAQLWALWRFVSVLSAFQVLPDAFLVLVLRTLAFSDTSVPRLVAGSVPLYMAAMWSPPLLWVLLACSPWPPPPPRSPRSTSLFNTPPREQNRIQQLKPPPSEPTAAEPRNGTRLSELALAACLALLVFGAAECLLAAPWHGLQLWSATASQLVLGHVAAYVLPAEAALGGATLVGHRATEAAEGWKGHLKRLLAGAAVATFYTGALCLSYLLIEHRGATRPLN